MKANIPNISGLYRINQQADYNSLSGPFAKHLPVPVFQGKPNMSFINPRYKFWSVHYDVIIESEDSFYKKPLDNIPEKDVQVENRI